MGLTDSKTLQTINFAFVTVVLTAICAGLVAIIVLASHGYAESSPEIREYRYRMALIAAALLALTVVLLVWMVIRRLAPAGGKQRPAGSSYVNAWSLAGKRAEPVEEDPET